MKKSIYYNGFYFCIICIHQQSIEEKTNKDFPFYRGGGGWVFFGRSSSLVYLTTDDDYKMFRDVYFFRLKEIGFISILVGLQSRCARNNFNQLAGNDSLAGTVKGHRQLVNHFTYYFFFQISVIQFYGNIYLKRTCYQHSC